MDVLKSVLWAMAVAVGGCAPTVLDDVTLVRAPRLLAVRAIPAEAPPGTPVRFEALVASPDAASPNPPLEWAFCNDRPSLAEPGPISARCRTDGAWITPLGVGDAADGTLPSEACRVFGPEPPITQQGAGGRPFDPDVTGGYQQPLRVLLRSASASSVSFFGTRIACGVQGATQSAAAEFTRRYRRNENPEITVFSRVADGGEDSLVSPDVAPVAVSPGASVRLRVAWPTCEGDAACGGAERYVVFDRPTQSVVERTEVLRVSWFATAGDFRDPRTAGDNVWHAPQAGARVRLWAVLRDDRGGVAWRTAEINVR